MNALELMDDIIHALNAIPNTRLHGRFRDPYALVMALEKAQRKNCLRLEIRGGVLQEPVVADFPEGVKLELMDYDSDERMVVAVVAKDEV